VSLKWLLIATISAGVLVFTWLWLRPDTHNTKPKDKTGAQTETKTKSPLEVTIEGVTPDQTITGSVEITLQVNELNRVARAEYYIDGVFAGVTYASPFGFTLNTATLTPGEHTITAKVYDQSGNAFDSQTITFIVAGAETTQSSSQAKTSTSNASTGGSSSSSSGGSQSQEDTTPTPDASAPTTPGTLLLSAEDGYTTNLSWGASSDNVAVTGYQVYRDGSLLGTVLGASTTSYQDQTVVPGNTYEYLVKAEDAADNASAASNEPSITLVPTSIWIAADSPQSFDTDSSPLELGVKFRPLVNGQVTGVKFYKGSGNTGTHVGTLWSAGGSNLASVTFSGETSSGWQQATFSTPVSVTAGTTYVVSYSAPNGHISYTPNYFATNGITSQYLTAMATGVDGGNGVFADPAGNFPSTTFNSTNYWVDATFTPNPAASGPTAKVLDTSTVYSGFPGSDNTGIPVGKRLPTRDRDVVIYEDGAVMENIFLTGEAVIRADDVTIRKSKINGLVYLDKDAVGAGTWFVTVEDSEVNAGAAQRGAVTLAQFDIIRSNLHGGQTGAICSNDCTVTDSWIHGQYLPVDQDWHLGGFLSNGGHDMTLTHNTISCDTPNNAFGGGCSGDLNLYGDFEAIQDVTIDGNLLTANADAGYCLTAGYNASKPFGLGAANIVVINNTFQRGTTNLCAGFGPFTDYTVLSVPAPGNVWNNNKWDDGTVLDPS